MSAHSLSYSLICVRISVSWKNLCRCIWNVSVFLCFHWSTLCYRHTNQKLYQEKKNNISFTWHASMKYGDGDKHNKGSSRWNHVINLGTKYLVLQKGKTSVAFNIFEGVNEKYKTRVNRIHRWKGYYRRRDVALPILPSAAAEKDISVSRFL